MHNYTCIYIHVCGIYMYMCAQDLSTYRTEFDSLSHMQHWGLTRLTTNSTALVFEYIHDDDGMVHDRLVLKK